MREISEGRMRADARGGGPVPVPSEGRIRAAGQVFQPVGLLSEFHFKIAQVIVFFRVDLFLSPVKVE